MESITKKRIKAFGIDVAISAVVTAGVERLLRKKIKSEAVHTLLTPTIVLWALEYAQLSKNGQTVGYRQLGLVLENEDGSKPTCNQLLKRMAYRDTLSSFDYIRKRKEFEMKNGTVLPHDRISGTVVKEV